MTLFAIRTKLMKFLTPLCCSAKISTTPTVPLQAATPKMTPSVYTYDPEVIKNRKTPREIHPLILARRSIRDLTPKPISDELLLTLFEAARWAPSCYNVQNWRFIYAKRDTQYWPAFLDSLVVQNQDWAKNASALVAVVSKTTFVYAGNTVPQPWASFDSGSAWMAMALEGTARGLVMHAMGGYVKEKVQKMIGLEREDFQVEAMLAIGYPSETGKKEEASQRNEVDKFVSEGKFTDKLV